jgi:hypothetical protein
MLSIDTRYLLTYAKAALDSVEAEKMHNKGWCARVHPRYARAGILCHILESQRPAVLDPNVREGVCGLGDTVWVVLG